FVALSILKNPTARAADPDTQTETGHVVVELNDLILAGRHRDFADVDLSQSHLSRLSPGAGVMFSAASLRSAAEEHGPAKKLGSVWEAAQSNFLLHYASQNVGVLSCFTRFAGVMRYLAA